MALVAQLRWLQSQSKEQIDSGCTSLGAILEELLEVGAATGTAHGPPALPP
ncbi:uncharacterized protein GGS25DRAFT_519902 [Hypoxylon fragiforme]|uniref:uncharacterized protein n=1 Tax=Hypoxylon fragiforme TaxID=63214 RepID=UPI0020C6CE9D|nr:uncharacterized protein GGS25DRAFT_519902 [Hypoxylon fragiforme]KAI2611596.1 hypothetical protein GGS25DRAFT_519902 [Hypoxylon fragiforme]